MESNEMPVDPDLQLMGEAFDDIEMLRAMIAGHRRQLVSKRMTNAEVLYHSKHIEEAGRVIGTLTKFIHRLGDGK